MQEKYIELEDAIIGEISIKDRINYLKPEIIEMIRTEYGNIDAYIEIFENKDAIERVMEYLVGLSWREQKVMMLRFGLFDGNV